MAIDLANDAGVFLNDFAEAVVYRPLVGPPRSIQAIVDREPPAWLREPPAWLAEADGVLVPQLHVVVRNDEAAGIGADEVDTGGDRVDVPVRVGGTAVTKNVVRIVQQDAGLLRLEVR